MAAQRTVCCPSCGHPRVTKATGRQRLACTNCGSSWLVRDATEPEPAAAHEPVSSTPAFPDSANTPVPANTAGVPLGGVEVLPPAALEIGRVGFAGPPPESHEPAVPEAPGLLLPDDSTPVGEPPGDPEPSSPAPVSPAPGRKLGYYRRVIR